MAYNNFNPVAKAVALTFCDGPSPYTETVLDILAKNKVKGSFSVVGEWADENRTTFKRIIADGHELINHGWTHRDLTKLTSTQIHQELTMAQKFLSNRPTLFRPPYGSTNDLVTYHANRLGLKVVKWTKIINRLPATLSDVSALEAVVSTVKSGDILLFHDGGQDDNGEWLDRTDLINILPDFISYIRSQSWSMPRLTPTLSAYPPKLSVGTGFATSCCSPPYIQDALLPLSPRPSTVNPSGRRLIKDGAPFVPFGYGIDGRYRFGNPSEDDFQTFLALLASAVQDGANTIRIYLQLSDFLTRDGNGNTVVRPESIKRYQRTLAYAEQLGVLLDVTGNLVWDPLDNPFITWYDQQSGWTRWLTQQTFWTTVAQAGATSPAILCYELCSEPLISLTGVDWYTGELDGLFFLQRIFLSEDYASMKVIARWWIRMLYNAVRRGDSTHMVSLGIVGQAPGPFSPDNVGSLLDFLLVHVYPQTGQEQDALDILDTFASIGKPVVIGETAILSDDDATQRSFLLDSRSRTYGVLSPGYRTPLSEFAVDDTSNAHLNLLAMTDLRSSLIDASTRP